MNKGKKAVVTKSKGPSATDAKDSGASKAISSAGSDVESTAASTVASTDSQDIGAPPKWLLNEMAKKSDTPGAAPSQQQNASDGGAGPSANSFN